MTDADPEVVQRVNELGDQVARLEFEEEALVKEIERRKRVVDEQNAARLGRIRIASQAAKRELVEHIESNRRSLIASGRQSFATQFWTFQFKSTKGGKLAIVEDSAEAIMKRAGRFGLIKKIAEPPKTMKWRFKLSKFLKRLEDHPEEQPIFEEFLTVTEDTESLRMSPNAGHTVFHDGARISPPSTTIKSK